MKGVLLNRTEPFRKRDLINKRFDVVDHAYLDEHTGVSDPFSAIQNHSLHMYARGLPFAAPRN